MCQKAVKDKTERATGLGRRTKEEWDQTDTVTALRFQTEWKHQKSPASLRGVSLSVSVEFGHHFKH